MRSPYKLTQAQIDSIPQLREEGMTQAKIAKMFHVGKSTIGLYCPKKRERDKGPAPLGEKMPANNKVYYYVTKDTLNKTVTKNQQAKHRLESIQPGNKIALVRFEGRRKEEIAGEVEKKLPCGLLIRNRYGRLEMVTFADLLTMKVVEG